MKPNKKNYLLIKKFNKKYTSESFNFFKNYGNCKIDYINDKNYLYWEYEKKESIDYILQNENEIIYKNFGQNVTFHKINKTPLDLNQPSKIVLIIFYNKLDIKIDEEVISDLLKNIGNPEKLIFFKKNNSDQVLIKFNSLDLAIKTKETLPQKILNKKVFLKVYYTDKKDIVVNKDNDNEFDYSIKSSVFSRKNMDSFNSLNNIKDNSNKSLFHMNSNDSLNKINSFNDLDFKDKTNCIYCLNSKGDLNSRYLFNLFSIYGNIEKIEISDGFERGIVHFKYISDINKPFQYIKNIPTKYLTYEVNLPLNNDNKSHQQFLIEDYNFDFINRKLKKNKTIKISKFQKMEKKQEPESELKNISINTYKFRNKDQRDYILSNKFKNLIPSNFLIIENLPDNINVIEVFKLFKTALNETSNFINYFKQIKDYPKYLLVCSNFKLALKILLEFHNYEYINNYIKVNFAGRRIINKFKDIFKIETNIDNYNNSKNNLNDIEKSNNNYSVKDKKLNRINSDYKLWKNRKKRVSKINED